MQNSYTFARNPDGTLPFVHSTMHALVIARNPDGSLSRRLFTQYKNEQRMLKHGAKPFANGREYSVHVWYHSPFIVPEGYSWESRGWSPMESRYSAGLWDDHDTAVSFN